MGKIEKVIEKIEDAETGVAFTGAGVSAPSGLSTFRGSDGIWENKDPRELASPSGFRKNPQLVWDWYNSRRDKIKEVNPNEAHKSLKLMEDYFREFSIVTQNVDNLHKEAGSDEVVELHGNIFRNKCSNCGRVVSEDVDSREVVECEECGGLIRPAVVWFGEPLPVESLQVAKEMATSCDICFIIGTSGLVQPAASIPLVARESGAFLVEINRESTVISDYVDISLNGDAAKILPLIVENLQNG